MPSVSPNSGEGEDGAPFCSSRSDWKARCQFSGSGSPGSSATSQVRAVCFEGHLEQ